MCKKYYLTYNHHLIRVPVGNEVLSTNEVLTVCCAHGSQIVTQFRILTSRTPSRSLLAANKYPIVTS